MGPAYVAMASCARFDCAGAFSRPGFELSYYGAYIGDEPLAMGAGAIKAVELRVRDSEVTVDGQRFVFTPEEIEALVFGPFAATGRIQPRIAEATFGPGLDDACAHWSFPTSVLLENAGELVWAQAKTTMALPRLRLDGFPYGAMCPREYLRPVTDEGTEQIAFAGKTRTRHILHLHASAVIGVARTEAGARAVLERLRALTPVN